MIKLKKPLIPLILVSVLFIFFAFKKDYFEVAKQIEIYTSLFKELNMYYIDDTNPAKLTDNALKHMLKDLDPYTKFYDEQGVEEAKINSSGEYSGIGALTKKVEGKLKVVEIYEGLPADDAGLKVGDEILKIDNIEIKNIEKNDVSSLIKGAEGTEINLEILRQNKKYSYQIVRKKVEMNPVPHYQMIDDEIGYISFIKFNKKASGSVKSAYKVLKSQGMQKLILDMRGNPGGLLNEAVNITNFFISKDEVVVTTKAKLQKWSETYKTKNEPIDLEIPLVVLIDGYSASAAEIVAGSLQDLDRAVIVGERSFGKGLVQRYRDLPYGTKLKLTISKYYTPSGRNIQELDYTNRKDDMIPKFSDNARNAFKTKNGRTVYDGGGIEPDIIIEKPETTIATKALYKSELIFDFATDYYYQHKTIAKPQDFIFTEKDYQSFLSYVNNNSSSFQTKTERIFELGIESAEQEDYKTDIQSQYSDLLHRFAEEKMKDLSVNKEGISEHISDEILSRYYFKKGEYINHIYHGKYIMEATKILNNDQKYNQILK